MTDTKPKKLTDEKLAGTLQTVETLIGSFTAGALRESIDALEAGWDQAEATRDAEMALRRAAESAAAQAEAERDEALTDVEQRHAMAMREIEEHRAARERAEADNAALLEVLRMAFPSHDREHWRRELHEQGCPSIQDEVEDCRCDGAERATRIEAALKADHPGAVLLAEVGAIRALRASLTKTLAGWGHGEDCPAGYEEDGGLCDCVHGEIEAMLDAVARAECHRAPQCDPETPGVYECGVECACACHCQVELGAAGIGEPLPGEPPSTSTATAELFAAARKVVRADAGIGERGRGLQALAALERRMGALDAAIREYVSSMKMSGYAMLGWLEDALTDAPPVFTTEEVRRVLNDVEAGSPTMAVGDVDDAMDRLTAMRK